MIKLETKHLKAALLMAPKKDIRYYLNSVLFRMHNGKLHTVATNGRTMLLGRTDPMWIGEPCEIDIIIPRETVQDAIKIAGKNRFMDLLVTNDSYSLGGLSFKPIEAKYPDYTRVIPNSCSGELGQYDADLLSAAQSALRVWHDDKNLAPYFHHNGGSCGIMTRRHELVFIAVMPWRTEKQDFAFSNED